MLNGKTAIITGASGSGMGRSIALTMAREGFAIVVNYLKNIKSADEIATYIEDRGGKAMTVQSNIFIKEECEKLVGDTIDFFGRIDVCIIGPGANWNPESLSDLNSIKAIQDINQETTPVYNLLPLLLKNMEKRSWGRIIGIASNMDIPSPSYSYNAAKIARIETLKLAVSEAWKKGVTINIIAPGPVDEIPSFKTACDYCDHIEEWNGRKKVTPQDIAEGVAFLCSDSGKYITGCILPYQF